MASSQQDEFNGYRLSGWWRRVGAYLLDGLIIWAISLVLFVLVGLLMFSGEASLDDFFDGTMVLFMLFVFFASFLIVTLYYGLTMSREGKRNGQSFGKQALGITVIREDGQAVDFWYAFKRQILVMQLLFGLVFNIFTGGIATLLDYLWPLWDDRRQALHDKMVSSRVAYVKDDLEPKEAGVSAD